MNKKIILGATLVAALTLGIMPSYGDQASNSGNNSGNSSGKNDDVRSREIALANPSNWSQATREIQTDEDQQALDAQQHMDPSIRIAGAKVFGKAKSAATTKAPAPIYNLINHNGPTLGQIKLYAIWWGPTANFPSGYQASIRSALTGLGCASGACTGMSKMMEQYLAANKKSASIQYSGEFTDISAPVASAPSAAQIVTEVNKVVTNAAIDPTALYLVFSSNFPKNAGYCGYHSAGAVGNTKWFTVSYMPNLTGVAGCGANALPGYASSGSGSATLGVDSVVNVLTHELYETMTDPMLTGAYAWYDALGYEIGDKCAWTTSAKMKLGSSTFTVQQEWSNAVQACASA